MPQFEENCHVFYRLYDGTVHDVSFAEVAQTKTAETIANTYGGDGTLLGSGQEFYTSLSKLGDSNDKRTRVKDKRMVFYWAQKDGARDVHETLSHSPAKDWETLPAQAASGYYMCKNPDMPRGPAWPHPNTGWCQESGAAAATEQNPTMRKPAGRPKSNIWSTNKPF